MTPALAAVRPDEAETVRALFLRACELDVAVRKPGNVSQASAGHGMSAALFRASARAAVEPLCRRGARVGERIEAAVAASWAAAGCNTNLGILLLCAPIARAVELHPAADSPTTLRTAIEIVLADLDTGDASAAYRAIRQARPAGLGTAPAQDVAAVPSIDLRAAMALAADRDSIARQYRDGYAELFELGLPPLLAQASGTALFQPDAAPTPAAAAAVQQVFLAFLARLPDSHIVRKRGANVAHSVMQAAQCWQTRALSGVDLDANSGFVAWDFELKEAGLNPGTSADLTVAALFAAGLIAAAQRDPRQPATSRPMDAVDGTERDIHQTAPIGTACRASTPANCTQEMKDMAKIDRMMVGESLVGDGNEVAHIDLIIGPRGSPVEAAFANALTNNKDGFTSLLAVVAPNLITKPATVMFNKVTIKGAKQAVQMFGPAQRGVAMAVADSVEDGTIPADEADNVFICVGVFIHWLAEDDQKIQDYNYKAVRESIQRAVAGSPTAAEVVAKKSTASHPYAAAKG